MVNSALLAHDHMAEIELVHIGGQLEAVGGIDLAQHRALRLGLADFGIQRGELAVHRRADGQRLHPGIGDDRPCGAGRAEPVSWVARTFCSASREAMVAARSFTL